MRNKMWPVSEVAFWIKNLQTAQVWIFVNGTNSPSPFSHFDNIIKGISSSNIFVIETYGI